MKSKRGVFKKSNAMKLDVLRFGIAGGAITSMCIMLTTIISMFGRYGLHSLMVREMYGMFGYSTHWFGVLIGGVYGFLDGFFMFGIFALIYNWLIR